MELTLHIGAHRTATTAMQNMLVASRPVLERKGVKALVHANMAREVPGFAQVPRSENWAPVRAGFDAAVRGADRVLVSEENLIGGMGGNIRSGTFYPRARRKLAAYRDFLEQPPVRIGLGIRDYESYWISAHAKELSYRDVSRGGVKTFAEARDGMASALRCWLDLVGDVRAVFPAAEILVWPVGAGIPVERLAARLIGDATLSLKPPPAGVNAAPAPGLIPAMEDMRRRRPGIKRAAMKDWLADQAPRRFDGFTADQRAHFAARYRADLDELSAGVFGVRLIGDPGAGRAQC